MASTLASLLTVVAVLVLALVFAKRVGWGAPSGPVRLLGKLPLDARRAVYLVEVGQTVLVLGASEAGVQKLAELSRAEVLGDKATSEKEPP